MRAAGIPSPHLHKTLSLDILTSKRASQNKIVGILIFKQKNKQMAKATKPATSNLAKLLQDAAKLKELISEEIKKNPQSIKELSPKTFQSLEKSDWCVINICGANIIA